MKEKAFAAVALGAILTSISGLLIKYMSIPATSMAWIRMTIPAVLMGLWMLWAKVPFFKGNLKFLLTVSVLNSARMYFFFLAYVLTSIGNAVIVLYTWPIFATIFGVLILKETISQRNILLLMLAFTGLIVVNLDKSFSWADSDFLGMLAALTCAIFYSLMMVLFKKESSKYSLKEMVFYQNFIPCLLFLPFFLTNRPLPTSLDVALASTLGLVVGIAAYFLFFFGLRHLKASTHSMITYLEIVSAITLGYIFLGETLTLNTLIGGLIIILSTVLLKN